ncbi:MAG: nucleoside deaminase [Gemmatimonadetes bacterium]|nr:nucleoside deaminase [Gemmatimonadota bacterium]NNM07197.1 nucleoside deaminase [Gemmatimonadota bacterium]
MSDLTFLRRAIALAEEHSLSGTAGPFGAVVVRDGEVVGEGWNRVVVDKDPTAHAEVLAIRNASRQLGTHALTDTVLYSSCEPCPMCLAAIYWARIPRVVYATRAEDARAIGFDDAFIAHELSLPWEERRIKSSQALREEAKAVMERWRQKPDRSEY